MTIVVAILGFMMGFLVCHLWEDKVREETHKEILKEMKESAEDVCDNDCEHCDWATCPKAEEGAEK